MKIRILSVARQELMDAIAYYNNERAGLGFEFAAEFKNTILRITGFPDVWPQITTRSRRCLMNRFPYAVLYQHNSAQILVVAVAHLRRDPQKWQERTS